MHLAMTRCLRNSSFEVIRQCTEFMSLLLNSKFCLPPEVIGACPALWQASLCHLAVLKVRTGSTVNEIEALADATFL